jgi:hypothetical protein
MSYLNPRVLDRGLESLVAEATRLIINPAQPADYAAADSAALGERIGASLVGPQNAASGRRVVVGPVTDGVVSVAGTAAFWALVDDDGERLLATAPLSNELAVSVGNAFTLTVFDITLPGVAT